MPGTRQIQPILSSVKSDFGNTVATLQQLAIGWNVHLVRIWRVMRPGVADIHERKPQDPVGRSGKLYQRRRGRLWNKFWRGVWGWPHLRIQGDVNGCLGGHDVDTHQLSIDVGPSTAEKNKSNTLIILCISRTVVSKARIRDCASQMKQRMEIP